MSTTTVLTAHEWAVEIDTTLSEIHQARQRVFASMASAFESIHYALGERSSYRSRSERSWPTENLEAEGLLRERLAAGEIRPWEARNAQGSLDRLDALRAESAALREVEAEFQAEYTGWSRFFLVTNSGGHIHNTMNCQTCNKMGKSTYFAWLPALSGLTEAEAVAEHGTILCSVCFPSAPVEWTVGKAKPAGCEGSGAYVKTEGTYRRYATCPVCGEAVSKTSAGMLRKHKPKVGS